MLQGTALAVIITNGLVVPFGLGLEMVRRMQNVETGQESCIVETKISPIISISIIMQDKTYTSMKLFLAFSPVKPRCVLISSEGRVESELCRR